MKFFATIFCLLSLALNSFLFAQTTVVFQPGPSDGIDIVFGSNPNFLSPDSNSTDLGTTQWTCGGSACELRSLIKFNLSSIPTNATIVSATLSLYANPQQLNGNIAAGPTHGTDNQSVLMPVVSSWNQSTVNWNNQPQTTTLNNTIIPQSSSNYQDYSSLDVTAAVQNMVGSPDLNFGWLMKIVTSNFYNCMIFCSSNFPTENLRPKLNVTYTVDEANCITLRPGPAESKDISFGNLPQYMSPDSMTGDFGSVQWTCGGQPCELRSLIKFDLSSIPDGSVVTSAKLFLYANPLQSNGNSQLGPMYGEENACNLHRVTSSWSMSSVNWNNQPEIDELNPIFLANSVNNFQDYTNIIITDIVQNWIDSPTLNYGLMMKMITANYYNSMIFCSGNFIDENKRPKLEICLDQNTTVGLKKISTEFSMNPNPANNFTTIRTKNNLSNNLEIFDVSGKLVYTEIFNLNTTINVSGFTQGMYFVKINNNEQLPVVKKLLIKPE